jgi:hypothetical protein
MLGVALLEREEPGTSLLAKITKLCLLYFNYLPCFGTKLSVLNFMLSLFGLMDVALLVREEPGTLILAKNSLYYKCFITITYDLNV